MTYEEICLRIKLEAQRGGEKAELANLDTESVIEAIMPSLLDAVTLECASNPDKLSLLRRTHSITITNGVGTLPDSVMTQCVAGAMVLEPDDDTVLPEDISFVPQYVDYVSAKGFDPRLGYFCVKGDRDLRYVSPTATELDYDVFDGDLEITVASALEIPATATETLTWDAEVISEIIDRGANMLRGMVVQA